MTDKSTTIIDIDPPPQGRQSEDDMDTDEEPPVTAAMLPAPSQPQPPSTEGKNFVLYFSSVIYREILTCRASY